MTAPLQDVTEETLAQIAKAQTSGILESTGVYSYDLSGIVSLIPVVTPFRDKVARKAAPNGNPFAIWRALMNINNAQPDPAMGFDIAANEVKFDEQDFQARYMPTGLAGLVTQDAVDLAKGIGDPYAIATFQVLNQVLIGDDRKLLGAQSYALATPAAPTVAQADTGGSIPASTTVHVAVAGRTGSGYFYGTGNSQANTGQVTTSTVAAATHSVTATISSVKGAVCYDWFQSSDGATWHYYTTTTVPKVTMTSVIVADAALPSLPDLATSWKGTANTKPTVNTAADNGSANANDYDGFLASLTGDYNTAGQFVTSGTATANGAVFQDNAAGTLTLNGGSIDELETLFLSIWNQVKTSPTALMVNAQQAKDISNKILSQPGAVTYLQPDDATGRMNAIAGGYVGSVVNSAAGGVRVPLEVHVSLPPGTIVARTDRVPFPQSGISNVLEYRALRDTSQYDYGIARTANTPGGGPRKEFEIRSVGAFLNRAPVAMGVLTGVASG